MKSIRSFLSSKIANYFLLILLIFCTSSIFMSCRQPSQEYQVKNVPINSLESELQQLYRADLLPQYRSGIVEQVSSYDTTGNNDDGFSGKYSFIRKEGDQLVLADLKGPGVINRIWTPTPTNDTIQFYFDGETSPRISIPFIDLFSGKIFPFIYPVCGNEIGGYYCYTPIQYNKSCKITYKGERIQFHQIQYRPYPENTGISSFSFDWSQQAKDELEKTCQFWNSQTNIFDQLKEAGFEIKEETKQFFISPDETITFFSSNEGGRIVGLEIEDNNGLKGWNKDIILHATWDNDSIPAIHCPAADFFGYAFGKPAMNSILAGNNKNLNYCYLPMPFQKKAELNLQYGKRNEIQPKIEIKTKVYYLQIPQNPDIEGRFYSVWRREINPTEGIPYTIAEIKDKGHYIGTIQQAQGLNPGMTLFFESDDSTVIDGKMRMHGTGSEDYYNGGWYALLDRWDRGVSLPIHGSLDYSLPMARTGGYRFYTTDKMTFEKDLLLTIEHGPEHNKLPVDYTSVAFYYGSKPTASDIQLNEELRTVYYPSVHVFYPQLMDLSLGWNTQVENKGGIEVSTKEEGLVRVMLNEVPEGEYKLYLSYSETPDGGEFSIWNRQKMISEWKNTNAVKETFLEKQELGKIRFTNQTNSISIKIRKNAKGNKFLFENLYLEKVM